MKSIWNQTLLLFSSFIRGPVHRATLRCTESDGWSFGGQVTWSAGGSRENVTQLPSYLNCIVVVIDPRTDLFDYVRH
jgi:hypothetical protein